ncbi:MAG: hypothetical protein NTY48_06515 [Candidatus Diapherotrites archaeon]|nr:hypothetical protein [Candidatus Diapherotrites archaeon]
MDNVPMSLLYPNLTASSSRDAIICILLDEPNLTAKEIYSRIIKSKSISYQAVFKELKQLCDVKTLLKTKNKYEISPDWIRQLRTFTNLFEQRSKIKESDLLKESKVLEFSTYYSFAESMLNLFASRTLIEKNGPNNGIGMLKHLWWSLSFGDQNFEKFKVMGKTHESYVACPNNTVVDQWLKDYYLNAGFKGIKLGVKYDFENDFAVVGNYIIQIFFDPETEKRLDHFYRKENEISTLIQKGFMEEIFSKKAQIKVIVYREPVLAKTLVEKLMPIFK